MSAIPKYKIQNSITKIQKISLQYVVEINAGDLKFNYSKIRPLGRILE